MARQKVRTATDGDAIGWFREASPYIGAHRGRTLVVALPGTLLQGDGIDTLVHDLALLSHLGLRLVVCFGLRAQVDASLAAEGVESVIVDGRRVTDDVALEAILASSGRARTALEARLSTSLPNTPMAGARLAVSSGNFVVARPFGVHEGVDFMHTGTVREIQKDSIAALLDAGHVVLVPPIGFSLTGDLFNLPADEIAAATAVALGADKLVYLLSRLPLGADGEPLRQASAAHAEAPFSHDPHATEHDARALAHAVAACRAGVSRVHLLELDDPDALLRELFTRDGSGTMITAGHWESVRTATIDDVGGLIELIAPLQENGSLAARSREQLEMDIERFVINERDGTVVACAALFELDDGESAEIVSLATHADYRGQGRADRLVEYLEARAREAGLRRVLLLSTRAAHWFIERGYEQSTPDELPASRRDTYNRVRNSKVFCKVLACHGPGHSRRADSSREGA